MRIDFQAYAGGRLSLVGVSLFIGMLAVLSALACGA